MTLFDDRMSYDTYTFTNALSVDFTNAQMGINITEPGGTFTETFENLRWYHKNLVDNGIFTVDVTLPPDLSDRGNTVTRQENNEYWRTLETLKQFKTKIAFNTDVATTGTAATPVLQTIEVQNADGKVLFVDSEEYVSVSVDVGYIYSATNKISGDVGTPGDQGPIVIKFSSGIIEFYVVKATSGTVTSSLANPKTTGLNVTDTNAVVFS